MGVKGIDMKKDEAERSESRVNSYKEMGFYFMETDANKVCEKHFC